MESEIKPSNPSKPLRILYAAGPGNIIGTFRYWSKGIDDPHEVAITYSSLFFTLCKQRGLAAKVISRNESKEQLKEGLFHLENRPQPLNKASGLLYHIGLLWYGLGIVVSAIRFRANFLIVTEGTTHWFVLIPLKWWGVHVVPSIHCLLWSKVEKRSWVRSLFEKLATMLFSKHCTAILAVSDEVAGQVKILTGKTHAPILIFRPVFKRKFFEEINPVNPNKKPFRVLFVGRIEKNKGVFDLLEIAKNLASQGRTDIIFDLCGNGSELEKLRAAIEAEGLQENFCCHGHCDNKKMKEMFSLSHVVVVPTQTTFVEGFNKVVAEGVLSGRPVITSSVCPAVNYVGPAVIQVEPDNVTEYQNAILRLCDDRQHYETIRQACSLVQEQFYDLSLSFGSKIAEILDTFGKQIKN